MSNDAIAAANARHMVMRILMGDLYTRACMGEDDPVQTADEWARASLSAIDAVTDKSGLGDVFNHVAIHELETFWEGVREDVRQRVQALGSTERR